MNLIRFRLSWENGPSIIQFDHNYAHGEHIDLFSVPTRSEYDFWGPIPPGAHVVRENTFRVYVLGESEISQFNSVVVFKNVLRFQITVEQTVLVHVAQSGQGLVDYVPNLDFGKGLLF